MLWAPPPPRLAAPRPLEFDERLPVSRTCRLPGMSPAVLELPAGARPLRAQPSHALHASVLHCGPFDCFVSHYGPCTRFLVALRPLRAPLRRIAAQASVSYANPP
jgi:hypothetical protein